MRLLNELFSRRRSRTDADRTDRIGDAVARVLAMNPRLKNAHHHEERLAQSLSRALDYTDDLVEALPSVRDANPEAWQSDPAIRAFFATPADLSQAFSRSETLRAWFERNADSTEAYAVLGMAMAERHILGVALEGDCVRHDVPQTTLCFSDHRVTICSDSDASLRAEIGRRLIDQLALAGFAGLAANRRALASESRVLLEKRVALLESQGAGLRAVVGATATTDADELARIQAEIEMNSRALARLRVPGQSAALELEYVCDVLSKPSDHLYVHSRHVLLDSMNVVQPEGSEAGKKIEFHYARIPGNPAVVRTFVLVRFPRRELLAGGLHIDAATRAI
jgi:hypothetical protein